MTLYLHKYQSKKKFTKKLEAALKVSWLGLTQRYSHMDKQEVVKHILYLAKGFKILI